MYECDICNGSFSTRNRLKSHRKQKHGTVRCWCRRMFVFEKEMEQHREDMVKNAKFYRCPDCCLSFHSELDKQHHLRSFEHGCPEDYTIEEPAERTKPKRHRLRRNKSGSGEHACHTCVRRFAKYNSLQQHQKSLGHLAQSIGARERVRRDSNQGYITVNQRDMTDSRDREDTTPRKQYFDDFYERNVKVDKSDMTMSRNIVDTTLNKLMSNVRDQRGGTMFNPNVIKAGSVPINAKIGKADEFDTNIELNVIPKDIRQHGTVNFGYVTNDDTASLKVKRDLCLETKIIPEGFATVKVEKGSVPNTLLHDNYIIPCKIKQDLFNKIETAKKDLSLSNVDISSKAHGPALTLTIYPDRYSGVKHDINVDITLSIKSDISVTDHGWPRPATKSYGKRIN
ncbi:uncharacterized protein LOC132720321 isoform X1 [Ruditapes philippinarum]|uniref:uncharacterized protein LOC132720321 isoform X1 n=1 Tax=Ruditapes philippinarum TaxID=129788 RepID=UPI00295BC367|nr:uncharacterized protein LOC132720321 isoform X1 [Ruditapes philippinarum]